MRRTTIILGAGFSNLYEYPLGADLVHLINDLLWETGPNFFNGKFDYQFLNEMKYGLLPSMEGSIDAYLNKRPQLKEIGYTSVSQILLGKENPNPNHLHRNNSFNPYRTIVDSLGDLRNLEPDKINIITFNYDRTFEQYLMAHVQAKYIMSLPDAKRVIERINYAHVYGQLGYLPWQLDPKDKSQESKYCLEYGSAKTATIEQIQIGARRIGTVYQKLNPSECETDKSCESNFEKALNMYKDSKNVFFLGFGYLKENMTILGHPPSGSGKAIMGTSWKLTKDRIEEITDKYGIELGGHLNTIENFLDTYESMKYLR
jgi:hypothetical protein